jgi:Uncharacterized protein conserved in bacteria
MQTRPNFLIIAGVNGAGKTTLTQRLRKSLHDMVIINPDLKPGNKLDQARAAISERNFLLQSRKSFAVETTGTGKGLFDLIKDVKKNNYKTYLIYIGLENPLLANFRVSTRVAKGGHDVDKKDVDRRYMRSLANLPNFLKACDRCYVFDNSSDKRHRLLLTMKNRKVIYVSKKLPHWFKQAVPIKYRSKSAGIEL